MAAFIVPAAIAGLSALGGALGNRKKTTTQSLFGTQTTNRTATTLPTYDPKALAMRDNLIRDFMARLSPGRAQGLAQDITTGNILNINKGAAAQRRALEASLASRGMGFSGLRSALGSEMEGNRIGEIVRALNQRRILAEQIQQGDLSSAGNFFGQLPAGSTMTENGTVTTNQTGTNTDPGNVLGGLFGGAGTALAGMYGSTGGFGQYPWYGRFSYPGVQGTNTTTNIDDLVGDILTGSHRTTAPNTTTNNNDLINSILMGSHRNTVPGAPNVPPSYPGYAPIYRMESMLNQPAGNGLSQPMGRGTFNWPMTLQGGLLGSLFNKFFRG